jgi:hypothetical protein
VRAEQPYPRPGSPAETYGREDEPNPLFFHGGIFPLDARFFAPSADIDDAIAHMIADGYLFHALAWIVSWELLRVRNTSIVVRYEDFIGDPEAVLRRVSHAVFPGNPDGAVASGSKAFAEKNYDRGSDSKIYPRGSTGAQGIWRNYFSAENRRLYNSVCERFIATHPFGPLLKRFYPDPFVT